MARAGRSVTPVGAVIGVTALGASFLLGVAVADRGATPTPTVAAPPTADPSPVRLVGSALTAPGSCEALLDSYVRRGVARVGPYGWDTPILTAMEGDAAADGSASSDAVEAPAPVSGRTGVVEQGSSATGTTVQEDAVDEPDVVKTDGALLVRVRDGVLEVHDVTGAPVEVGAVSLPSSGAAGEPQLLLADDTVVVTSSTTEGSSERETHVLTYDLTDPVAPTLLDHRSYDAALVRAVQHDEAVRLVLSAGLPDLDFVEPRFWRDSEDARRTNQAVVTKSEVTDWLPRATTYDTAGRVTADEPLLDCDRVIVPRDPTALGTVAVVGFSVDAPDEPTGLGVATDTTLAYVSATRLYLATGPWSGWTGTPTLPPGGDVALPAPPSRAVPADAGRTRVHSFALAGQTASYVASGVLDGTVADRWSMDEHDGVLRLAVGPTATTGPWNAVVTLREDGGDLVEVGRVDRIGVGERITAVRWSDDLAVVVTFRQVDPLYPIDLTDPERPRLLGELKIPGFSDYLHPLSGQRLLGLGQDASVRGIVRGAQAALFDVSDPAAPEQTDRVRYGRGSVAAAGADPRQFTWLPDRDTGLAVVSRGASGWVSVLEVAGDRLEERRVALPAAGPSEVAGVRLVPLPDGRVVLVTDEGVALLAL